MLDNLRGQEASESFTKDIVSDRPLPEYDLSRSARDTADAPEKRLMLAVLLNAIIQLQSDDPSDLIEVETWLRADTSEEPFAFFNICEVLGIESTYLRRGLLASRSRPAGSARRPPIRHVRIGQPPIVPSSERGKTADRRSR